MEQYKQSLIVKNSREGKDSVNYLMIKFDISVREVRLTDTCQIDIRGSSALTSNNYKNECLVIALST